MNFVICLAVWFLAATGTVSHKQATFVSSFQAIQLNNALFSILFFFSSSFSVFNVFLPLCCLSFVFTYLWSVFYSCSVSFLFLSFSPSLGIGMKTKPVIFFLQRALNISVLHFFSSLFMCSLFFFSQAPLMCLWIRYHSVWMSSQTKMRQAARAHTHNALPLFIPEASHMQSHFLVCQSFLCAAPPTSAHTILKNEKPYLHKHLVSSGFVYSFVYCI